MPSHLKRPKKPTVFLSHSSSNRRELLGLKRLLDERAGGMIEFFLSSDDDSIAHGTIWPAEVTAALERMSLMLIFVSSEALKSGWTYFEAGFGLRKLGSANIYCLPGTDKARLPSPFNLLQNRNLHSAREVALLIRQINDTFGGKMDDTILKDGFDRIFKRPPVSIVEAGLPFEERVESLTVATVGPCDSIEIFCRVCQEHGFPISAAKGEGWQSTVDKCSTGVRLSVENPGQKELSSEFKITNEIRERGDAQVVEYSNCWQPFDSRRHPYTSWTRRTLREIENNNVNVRLENARLRKENAGRLEESRVCKFSVSPINVSVPITIIDHWIAAASQIEPLAVEVKMKKGVSFEARLEAISAKIHGSPVFLREDGSLLWVETVVATLRRDSGEVCLSGIDGKPDALGKFAIPELVSSLFEVQILWLSDQKGLKRKRH